MKIVVMIRVLIIIVLFSSTINLAAQDDEKEIFNKAIQMLTTINVEIAMDIDVTDAKGRLKSKGVTILLAKFGDKEKTKVIWQKPKRAKGTTIIITDIPDQTGVIEVYTPSNGKTRKLKATEENMNMIGSEFNMASFAKYEPDELNYKLLNDTVVNGSLCFKLFVREKDAKGKSGALLVINKSTYLISQTVIFNEKGRALSVSQLYDYKKVKGSINKMYPMRIATKDYKNKKDITVYIINITPKKDLKESDFVLSN